MSSFCLLAMFVRCQGACQKPPLLMSVTLVPTGAGQVYRRWSLEQRKALVGSAGVTAATKVFCIFFQAPPVEPLVKGFGDSKMPCSGTAMRGFEHRLSQCSGNYHLPPVLSCSRLLPCSLHPSDTQGRRERASVCGAKRQPCLQHFQLACNLPLRFS